MIREVRANRFEPGVDGKRLTRHGAILYAAAQAQEESMPLLNFSDLWDNHPYPATPCDSSFVNQCAIRMGVALQLSGLQVTGVAKCWFKHSPRHVLRAQELANALVDRVDHVGRVEKHRSSVTSEDFAGQRGIVFIMDGWGATDHIDLWNGSQMKAGDSSYFARGKQVWFWKL
jgi:hypothetical protein